MKFVEGKRLDKFIESVASVRTLAAFSTHCMPLPSRSAPACRTAFETRKYHVGPFGEVLVMDWGLAKILRERARLMQQEMIRTRRFLKNRSIGRFE